MSLRRWAGYTLVPRQERSVGRFIDVDTFTLEDRSGLCGTGVGSSHDMMGGAVSRTCKTCGFQVLTENP